MEISDIASLSGKGGLFRIVKPTRTGVILESLDEKKSRVIAHATQRVSSLHEISIYTYTQDGSVELAIVFNNIWKEFGEDVGLDSSSSPEELRAFMSHILPDYDEDKVYVSDIKRLVSWYNILLREAPEIVKGKEEAAEEKKEDEKPAKKSKTKAKKEE